MDATEFYSSLGQTLEVLDARRRVAFAATCAERLSRAPTVQVPPIARIALDQVWEDLLDQTQLAKDELNAAIQKCEELIADEDALDGLHAVTSDDALAAIV